VLSVTLDGSVIRHQNERSRDISDAFFPKAGIRSVMLKGKAGEPQSTSQSGTNDPLASPPQIVSEPIKCEEERRSGTRFVISITIPLEAALRTRIKNSPSRKCESSDFEARTTLVTDHVFSTRMAFRQASEVRKEQYHALKEFRSRFLNLFNLNALQLMGSLSAVDLKD